MAVSAGQGKPCPHRSGLGASLAASWGWDGESDGGGGGCLHQQILFSDKPC